MLSNFYAFHTYTFKHPFFAFNQVIPILQVPVNIQFFPSAILSPNVNAAPHNLWSVRFWLEYQRFPWPRLGQWLPRTAHRNELVVIFIPTIYYNERTQSKVNKGKRHMRWSPEGTGSRVPNVHKLTSWGVTQDVLNSCSCECW